MTISNRLKTTLMSVGVLVGLLLTTSGNGATGSADLVRKPPPKSIAALRSARFAATWTRERDLPDGTNFSAYLISYRSAGLKVHALVAQPHTTPPPGGFPVVIANHGFHPNPQKYGITAAGVDSRPGDYYRSVPELFVGQGFMVVMPDYRGHNNSEGANFTEGLLASAYYTEDVLVLAAVTKKLANADARNLFLWGHSMGGEVTLRAALANSQFRAASMWSSVGGDIWDQAYYYSRYENREAPDGSDKPKKEFVKLKADIAALRTRFDWRSVEPLLHLDELKVPLIIHHSIGDMGADYNWSERLAKELSMRGNPFLFHSYAGDEHFFRKDVQQQAAQRDADFFRGYMQQSERP